MKIRNIIIVVTLLLSILATNAQQINPITQAMLDGYEQILSENPQDYFILYQRSAQYYRLSLYDKALNDIDKAITYTPTKDKEMLATEYSLAADIYIQIQDYTKALSSIDNALVYNPDYYPYIYQKGNICLHLQNTTEAKKCFTTMQRLQSRSQEAFFGLAKVAIIEGNTTEAQSYMTEAENAAPSNYITYCRLGDLCMDLKDYDKAATHYLSGFGLATDLERPLNSLINLGNIDYKATANAIDYALTKTTNRIPLYFLKGNIALTTQHLGDAYDAFGKLLDTDEGKTASVYTQMAIVCHALSNQAEALRYINFAIEQNSSAENYIVRSKIELALESYDTAIADAKSALMLNPESIDALISASLAHLCNKKFDNAIDYLNNAISINPNNMLALMIRAYIYNNHLQNAANAVADYNKVAQMETYKFPEYAYKALAQTLSGKKIDGDATINEALSKATGKNAEAYYYAAVYYAQTGNLTKALEMLAQAQQMGYENDYNIWDNKITNLNVAPIRYLMK